MSQTQSQSRLDSEPYFSAIRTQIIQGDTNAGIARLLALDYQLETSPDSIRRFRKRHKINPDGTQQAYTRVNDNTAEAATPPTTTKQVLDDPDIMLTERGLDPVDWVITHLSPNMYEGPNSAAAVAKGGPAKITYYQTKFTCQRVRPPELQIVAPRTDGWKAPKPKPVPRSLRKRPRLFVVVGDQQAPFFDPGLHSAFVNWLSVNVPDEGISLGDSYDFPDIRPGHRLDPENNARVNECLQTGYDMFRGYRDASLNTRWRKLLGNHDDRLRNVVVDTPNVQPLYGLKRPDTPEEKGEKVFGLSHLGRLDELQIEVIDAGGSYELGQINLSDKLAVRHGWIARKGSGTSASATLEHLGYSIIVGHTHRQSIVHDTKHEITGRLRQITGVEAGCMCRVDQTPDPVDGRIWPSYTPAPDWQQGFATVEVWPDGYFNIDTAKYVNGVLMWRDQRYTA